MAHFLPPEHVRQVNKLEWPYPVIEINNLRCPLYLECTRDLTLSYINRLFTSAKLTFSIFQTCVIDKNIKKITNIQKLAISFTQLSPFQSTIMATFNIHPYRFLIS